MPLSYLSSNFLSQAFVLTKLGKGGLSELSKSGTKNVIFGNGFPKTKDKYPRLYWILFFLSVFI